MTVKKTIASLIAAFLLCSNFLPGTSVSAASHAEAEDKDHNRMRICWEHVPVRNGLDDRRNHNDQMPHYPYAVQIITDGADELSRLFAFIHYSEPFAHTSARISRISPWYDWKINKNPTVFLIIIDILSAEKNRFPLCICCPFQNRRISTGFCPQLIDMPFRKVFMWQHLSFS